MAERERIYWDSCVFIDCIQETADRIKILESIVEAAKSGEVRILTSTLAIAEVVRCEPDRALSKDDADKIKAFFENDFISVRQLDRETAELAADISRQYGLKPPDAIHVATAIKHKCQVLNTYDGRNKKKKGKLLKYDGQIGVPPLKIQEPQQRSAPPKQRTLLDALEELDRGPKVTNGGQSEPPLLAFCSCQHAECKRHPMRPPPPLLPWRSPLYRRTG